MIRYIQEKDVDAVLNLGKELHEESPIFNTYKWDEERTRQFIYSIIFDENQCGVLAFNKKLDIVGMIFGYVDQHYFSKDISLQEHFIYVKKESRGGKTVFKMINEWVKWGIEKGAKDVWVYCNTGIDYDKANNFFRGIGFKEVGTQFRR
tara:strand:- start:5277 stop:5723 length:447 start_codon:yes stop_codon:yes gene_type:complete